MLLTSLKGEFQSLYRFLEYDCQDGCNCRGHFFEDSGRDIIWALSFVWF